jgi:hypothetical protein
VRDPWQRAVRAVKEARTPHIVVDAAGVDYCDGPASRCSSTCSASARPARSRSAT